MPHAIDHYAGGERVYARGDVDKPGEKTARGFLTLLSPAAPPAIPPSSSGRRELAEWDRFPAKR
jgi:hypothetical protein